MFCSEEICKICNLQNPAAKRQSCYALCNFVGIPPEAVAKPVWCASEELRSFWFGDIAPVKVNACEAGAYFYLACDKFSENRFCLKYLLTKEELYIIHKT